MHLVQPRKVQIASVHDVESTRFDGQDIEHIDVSHLAVADVNEAGNAATQIQQRVQLDGRLGGTKRRPIEQAQAQVDGARIQGIDIARDIDTAVT